jgi:hypothetical protein
VMLDPVMPVAPEMVKSQRVRLRIDQAEKPVLHRRELGRIDFAFKHRILDPLAIIETGFRDVAQTSPALGRKRGDIVGNEKVHLL